MAGAPVASGDYVGLSRLLAPLILAVLSVVIGCGWSWWYWGYFFSTAALAFDDLGVDPGASHAFVEFEYSLPSSTHAGLLTMRSGGPVRTVDYYGNHVSDLCLSDVLPRLRKLNATNCRPAPIKLDLVAKCVQEMASSGAFRDQVRGLEMRPFYGFLLCPCDGANVVVYVKAFVWDDHWACIVSRLAVKQGQLQVLRSWRHYFDIAGLEVLTWWLVALCCLLPLVLLCCVAVLARRLLRHFAVVPRG